ncbi:adaptin N terminal region-domain-containing protein [Ostreococcus tauri]|uniref:Coatomer subunit gamma n=1 Tax=Ostreococcus tauri TaxID=70448 RepID=A0A1Y5HXL8_OSTTA|nr:adaptin N terminal region-domain-containing protein [Ostreococcus tauri]
MESTLREPQSFKKRDEDSYQDDRSPFWAIEKGAVLQEARCFNDNQISTRRCQQVITKLLYLYNQGQHFTTTEATEVFFSVTKLFHATDGNLRRLLYLIIKEISPGADEVIIVTSSLMKDMNNKIDLNRANSIRVLCCITDAGLLGQIERFLKQAVVDKSPVVASAALVSGLRLMKVNSEIVRRWSSEVQEASSSDDPMVQFHAIALLHQIKQHDRLAVGKLVLQCIRNNIRSPLATCCVIRYISEMLSEGGVHEAEIYYGFLDSCLRNKCEMVVFEAAKTVASLPEVDSRILHSAMMVLQLLLSSPKAILRFGAVRTLHSIALRDPASVTVCNVELESLVADSNRAISTTAITTLLRSGSEGSVDRLMHQIMTLFAGLQDEYKLTIVNAIKALCSKYPSKHRSFISFLSSSLREEGGFEYKRAIVDCVLHIVHSNMENKELGLINLSEFIEDCEYTQLSVHILHVLGEEGPSTGEPSKFIRYIYNRLFLENAAIRGAAVTALMNFGVRCPSLREKLAVLLLRCIHDADDEVRDRATLCGHWLKVEGVSFIPDIRHVQAVERALGVYLASGMEICFDVHDVQPAAVEDVLIHHTSEQMTDRKEEELQFISAFKERAEFATVDSDILSSKVFALTESETEYKVTYMKHILSEHIVFQFACVNTLSEQVLEGVTVKMDLISSTNVGEEFEEQFNVALPLLRAEEQGFTYVCFTRSTAFNARFACALHFTAKDIDPVNGLPEDVGYEDDYVLEDVEVRFTDFMSCYKSSASVEDWELLPSSTEISSAVEIGQHATVDEALQMFLTITNFSLCRVIDSTSSSRRCSYVLGAVVDWQDTILAKVELNADGVQNYTVKVTTRADSNGSSEVFHEALKSST